LEKAFSIVETSAKGGKLLGERVSHCGNMHRGREIAWGKGFNIMEIGAKGRKLHRKHPQISA